MADARSWAIRCFHESQCHYVSSFITLTLDDPFLAARGLDHSDFQLFMKRLRKRVDEVRYFMCGEYGEKRGRPHYHAVLFGLDHRQMVEDAWRLGHVHSDEVNSASIAYVTGYVTKVSRAPVGKVKPYREMSRRPALGLNFFNRYKSDFRHGKAIWSGMETSMPAFYRKKLDPDVLEKLQAESYERFQKLPLSALLDSRSPARLASGDAIAKAKVNLKWRDYE